MSAGTLLAMVSRLPAVLPPLNTQTPSTHLLFSLCELITKVLGYALEKMV